MKRLPIIILVFLVAGLATACGAVADNEGFKIGNPESFAQATHIARLSQEAVEATRQAVSFEATETTANIRAEATRSAIQNQERQAEADKVRAAATVALSKAKSEVEAQPAQAKGLATAYLVGYIGLGLAVLVLTVGLAFGLSAWVNKRANVVYPNKQGQFPLIPERGPGWTVYHDPNRAIGPGVVVTRPGLVDQAAHVLALIRGRVEARQPSAEYPTTASEPAMLQVATGAQAVQDQVARQSGRPKFVLAWGNQPEPARPGAARGRMPQISVINDPEQIQTFERKLLDPGGDE